MIYLMHVYLYYDKNKEQGNAADKQEQQNKTQEFDEKRISGIL